MKYLCAVNPDKVLHVDVLDVETNSMYIAFIPPFDGGAYIVGCIPSLPHTFFIVEI